MPAPSHPGVWPVFTSWRDGRDRIVVSTSLYLYTYIRIYVYTRSKLWENIRIYVYTYIRIYVYKWTILIRAASIVKSE